MLLHPSFPHADMFASWWLALEGMEGSSLVMFWPGLLGALLKEHLLPGRCQVENQELWSTETEDEYGEEKKEKKK